MGTAMTTDLTTLPHTVHFVCPDPDRWRDLFASQESGRMPEPGDIHDRIIHNSDSCIVLTFLQLKRRGVDVRLVEQIEPGGISVTSGINLALRHRLQNDGFVIACRTDGWDPVIADFTVVHNPHQAERSASAYIPTWPQPGLVARDAARGDRIENVVYKGDLKNLYEPFRDEAFRAELAALGVTLVLDGKSDTSVAFNDYSDADLVIAARDLTVDEARSKPASKLVNAWLAGVPAALGPEPAFHELRRSDLDYAEVRSPGDLLSTIVDLRHNPQRYRQMVDNGLARGQEFTEQATAERWHRVLGGPAEEGFERWRATGPLHRRSTLLLRAPRYRRERAATLKLPFSGPRILTG